MNNRFAAHHEAGHAVVAAALGAKVDRMGLTPTPHCLPNVEGLPAESIAAICMGGAAATMIYYDTMGPCATDVHAAKQYEEDWGYALARAIAIIKGDPKTFEYVVDTLLAGHDPEKECEICVDTVRKVWENDCRVEGDTARQLITETT